MASAAGLALVLALAGEAGALHAWLSVRGSGVCASSPESLASRIVSATIGTPKAGLRVQVRFAEGAGPSARVRLLEGSRSIGTKRLAAPSCEELRDAVVAVVALALSSEPPGAPRVEVEAAENAVEPAEVQPAEVQRPLEARPAAATPIEQDRTPRAIEEPPLHGIGDAAPLGVRHPLLRDWRLSLAVGADDGTLAERTAIVRAGAAARLGQGELRAVGSYGVPSVRELETDRYESVRTDFAALGFDYCHGIDAGRWFSACAGLELALGRYSEVTQAADRERIERERFDLGAAAVLGLALVYRDASVQPQLELSARLPVLGELAGAPPLGVRATFGAAVQF